MEMEWQKNRDMFWEKQLNNLGFEKIVKGNSYLLYRIVQNFAMIITQSIQSLVLELYRHGLGLLWASLNQTKQKKYLKNCFKIKDFMKVFKLNLFFIQEKK